MKKGKDGGDMLEGLRIGVDDIDEIICIIGECERDKVGMERLEEGFKLCEGEGEGILDMGLGGLSGLEG
ncbi:hypothetical protein, partial [Staphylococcus hominis]|uniref:hypothetical protein n=1 Tax=Staphylococcus hominis TaxID=1290 RepID=UPI0011A27557